MTKNITELNNRILSLVGLRQGIKGIDLSTTLTNEFQEFTNSEILDAIFALIENGELVEVEYVLPNNTSKSFILPTGTNVNIIDNE